MKYLIVLMWACIVLLFIQSTILVKEVKGLKNTPKSELEVTEKPEVFEGNQSVCGLTVVICPNEEIKLKLQ